MHKNLNKFSDCAIFTLTLLKDLPTKDLHKPCSLGYQSLAVPIRHQFHRPSHLVSLHQDLECVGAYPSPFKEKKVRTKTRLDIVEKQRLTFSPPNPTNCRAVLMYRLQVRKMYN